MVDKVAVIAVRAFRYILLATVVTFGVFGCTQKDVTRVAPAPDLAVLPTASSTSDVPTPSNISVSLGMGPFTVGDQIEVRYYIGAACASVHPEAAYQLYMLSPDGLILGWIGDVDDLRDHFDWNSALVERWGGLDWSTASVGPGTYRVLLVARKVSVSVSPLDHLVDGFTWFDKGSVFNQDSGTRVPIPDVFCASDSDSFRLESGNASVRLNPESLAPRTTRVADQAGMLPSEEITATKMTTGDFAKRAKSPVYL